MSRKTCIPLVVLVLLLFVPQIMAAKSAEWIFLGEGVAEPVVVSGPGVEFNAGSKNGNGGWVDTTKFSSGIGGLQVLTFDGLDDVVTSNAEPEIDISNSLYVDAWIYLTKYTNYGRILETGDFELFVTQSGQLKLQQSNTTGTGGRPGTVGRINTRSQTSLELNQWVRVSASYSAADGYARLFINGKEVEGYADQDAFKESNRVLRNSQAPIYIGNGVNADRPLAGAIAWLYMGDAPSQGPQATEFSANTRAFLSGLASLGGDVHVEKAPKPEAQISMSAQTSALAPTVVPAVAPIVGENELSKLDVSIECGWQGTWTGTITVVNGLISEATPILLEKNEGIVERGQDFIKITASTSGDMDGVRIRADVKDDGVLIIDLYSGKVEVPIATLREKKLVETEVRTGTIISVRLSDYDAWGREGGHYEIPAAYVVPQPTDEVMLPGDGWEMANTTQQITLLLDDATALEKIDFRHYPGVDGRLHLELFSSEEFTPAVITLNATQRQIAKGRLKSLFLDLPAFIGYYEMKVGYGDNWRLLKIPAATIATKGSKLYLNGDEVFSKGGIIFDEVLPSPATSFLMKNMGFNTVIRSEQTPSYDYHEKWGFTRVNKTEALNILKDPIQSWSDNDFLAKLDSLLQMAPVYKSYIASPMVIATFFANESASIANTWMSYHNAKIDQHGRLSSYLVSMNNAVKQISPMIPTSYANHRDGYRLPSDLDIYMHNSYYYIDRNPIPLEEYMRWQGYPDRPVYMKEFSSNTYLEEIYQGGRNNPIFGKIRQWAFEERWHDYVEAGMLGGSLYTVFDYQQNTASRDGNTASFGIFTREQQPKLIAYSVWKEYIDLIVQPNGTVENKRDYPIHNLKLLLIGDKGTQLVEIKQLAAREKKQLSLAFEPSFWAAQFETHKGLLNQQIGACTEALFQWMYSKMLDQVSNGSFLKELLPTEVMGWDGERDHYLMNKFEKDGVIAVAFQKAPGEYYLTAWTQNKTVATRPQTLTFFDTGDVRMIDDVSGEPLRTKPNYEVKDGKLVFHDLRLPYIGRSISDRSATEIHLPVIQVSKNGFADAGEILLPGGIVPDQFQLSGDAVIALNANKTAQTFTNHGGNIGSFVISPAQDTGTPQGAVTVKLCPLTLVGMPDEMNTIATQTIAPDVWGAHIGKLLTIGLHTELKPQEIYALVISSTGDADNHRNLSASATAESALTASYGPGRIIYFNDDGWVGADNSKQSLFFVTLAD